MRPLRFITLSTIALCAMAITPVCKKSVDLKMPDAKTVSNEDDAKIAATDAIFSAADQNEIIYAFAPASAKQSSSFASANGSSCPPVTTYKPAPNVYPREETVDYGSGCTSSEGITRSGKIIFKYSGDMSLNGSRVITHYSNFYLNGVKIEGETKMVNKGPNTNGQLVFKLVYDNRKVTQPNGDYSIISGARKLLKMSTAGSGYPGFPDGDFRISGSLSYTRSIGGKLDQFTQDITKPLVYKYGCPWVTKGILVNTFSDSKTTTLDYGSGTCDSNGTLTTKDGTIIQVTF